jgi:ribonuclease HII
VTYQQYEETVIVGIDESGRGALAGPVVAGAVMLHADLCTNNLIKDSKKLLPKEREDAYEWITKNFVYGYGVISADVVDSFGILEATERAMQEAVSRIATQKKPTYLLIDGRDKFWFDYPHSSIIRGDEKEVCISAASIIAKVTRDRLMVDYAKEFPAYVFEEHKGYGTPLHIKELHKTGPCPLHRKSFLSSICAKLPSS